MGDIPAMRTELAARLKNVEGLRGVAEVPSELMPPMGFIKPASIGFDATMGRGSDAVEFKLYILVSKTWSRATQKQLDGFLAGSGPTSVKAAIEEGNTLDGVVDWVRVVSLDDYGPIDFGDLSYLGAELTVEVMAHG